ncbi:hypothetical protein ACFVSU_12280 [Microbacterium sp. NPDC058062]|uniref:hypothetical protein n=1 Tax=Microbacterium sp. NPDC058062 TaxID=3346320 RepID=UPI0036DDD863
MTRRRRTPRPLPESLGDVFAVREALLAGVTERRLRHDGLAQPFHGARMRAGAEPAKPTSGAADESPITVEARRRRGQMVRRARAFWCVAGEGSFFSHVTAAVLWNLPLPIRLLRPRAANPDAEIDPGAPADIDVAVLAPIRASRAAGVRGRQLAPASTTVVVRDALRVTDPATTWALLGEELSVDELVQLGDAIVHIPRQRGMKRGTRGLATVDELTAALAAGRRRGAAKLRAALPLIRVGSASTAETDLRLALERAELPDAELDFDLIGEDGKPFGCTEIAYPRWRVLVEYEGDHHRLDRAQWNRDIEKHAKCAALGWTVIRLTAAHLYPRREGAVIQVRGALLRFGWRP